jgi:hypothetical protein
MVALNFLPITCGAGMMMAVLEILIYDLYLEVLYRESLTAKRTAAI